jgi:peptide-methionine (R)-S-oxide reductase
MNKLLMIIALLGIFSCQAQEKSKSVKNKAMVNKTEEEWQKQLTPQQYDVLRNKGTERAFTGEYWNHFDKGHYVCAACNNVLFESKTKFKSDCGWPSFDQAIKGSVIYSTDKTFGMTRTEVMCAKCHGHLGHVFDDGPLETTGKRFCTNSVSIKFVKDEVKQ